MSSIANTGSKFYLRIIILSGSLFLPTYAVAIRSKLWINPIALYITSLSPCYPNPEQQSPQVRARFCFDPQVYGSAAP